MYTGRLFTAAQDLLEVSGLLFKLAPFLMDRSHEFSQLPRQELLALDAADLSGAAGGFNSRYLRRIENLLEAVGGAYFGTPGIMPPRPLRVGDHRLPFLITSEDQGNLDSLLLLILRLSIPATGKFPSNGSDQENPVRWLSDHLAGNLQVRQLVLCHGDTGGSKYISRLQQG